MNSACLPGRIVEQKTNLNYQFYLLLIPIYRFLAVFLGPEGSGKHLQDLGAALGTALSDQVKTYSKLCP